MREMSSISTLEIAWEHKSSWRRLLKRRNRFLLGKLLKRINSSCSSGRERRKSVSGIVGTIRYGRITKAIWKW